MYKVGDVELPDLPANQRVAFDTETSGLFVDGAADAPPARVSAVSVAWLDGKGKVVSHAWPFDQGFIPDKPGRVANFKTYELVLPKNRGGEWPDASHNLGLEDWNQLAGWLQKRSLVAHHAKFDCHIMAAGLRKHPGSGVDLSDNVVWCTQIAQGLLEPLLPTSLKPSCARLWGDQELTEQEGVKAALRHQGVGLTKRYDLLDWEVIGPYADDDARKTIRLWNYQTEGLNHGRWGGWSEFYHLIQELELPMMRFLFRMERRGLGFDVEGSLQEANKARVMLTKLAEPLPFDTNINQAKAYYFGSDGLGLVPYETTDTGQISLTASVLERMEADGVPFAAQYARVRKLETSISKWYEGWPHFTGPDGRIRPNFRQNRVESDRPGGRSGGAISGRLSVERVQFQAIPQPHRIPEGLKSPKSFIIPKPGHQLWELDMSQAEVRIATWASRCEAMARILQDLTADVHGATAKLVFGVAEDSPEWNKYRQVAKRLTFAMIYGAGVRTTRAQILEHAGVDYSEAKTREMIETYREAFPEFVRCSHEAQQQADRAQGGPGFVKLVSGRRRWFGWGERTHKAFNAKIQGGQAEALKYWLLATDEKYPDTVVLTVHDSTWLEVPEDNAAQIVKDVRRLGSRTLEGLFSRKSLPIPFPIDSKRVA